jgi:hypothetical protein
MSYQILEEFTDYIQLGFYFKAHELLEERLWKKGKNNLINLYYKGLINGAVAMELIRKGRVPQGKKVWKTYIKYKIDSFYEVNHKMEKQYAKILNIREH